jgi:hypothetical protein
MLSADGGISLENLGTAWASPDMLGEALYRDVKADKMLF